MKKAALMLTASLLILLALLPYVIGRILNDPARLEQLAPLLGQSELDLQLTRGWFSSSGVAVIDNPIVAGTRYDGIRFTTPVHIQHGPLLFTDAGPQLGFAWGVLEPRLNTSTGNPFIDALLAGSSTARVTLKSKLDGSIALRLQQARMDYRYQADSIAADDLHISLDVAANRAADLRVWAQEARLVSPAYTLEAQQASFILHSASLDASPLPGSLAIAMDLLQITATEQLTLRGIRIDYAAREEHSSGTLGSTLSLQQRIQVDDIASRLPLTALTLETQVTEIGLDSLQDYRELLSGDALLLRLLQNRLAQHSVAKARAWGGAHELTLDLHWPGMPSLRSVDELTTSTVLRTLDGRLDIKAEAAAIAQSFVGPMARNYAAQGMLPQNNGYYELSMMLQGGGLLVNGQPIALEPLFNLLSLMNR